MEATTIETKIEGLVLPLLEGTDVFPVQIRIKPTNNVKVFLDADGGLNIATCAKINRKLNELIEEAALFPEGDFSLEVSSPGIDEPLRSLRQYRKNQGRTLEVTLADGSVLLGMLKEVQDEQLILHLKGTKTAPPKDMELPYADIKTAIVQVVF
jgi:ribosome maturation factor RimP